MLKKGGGGKGGWLGVFETSSTMYICTHTHTHTHTHIFQNQTTNHTTHQASQPTKKRTHARTHVPRGGAVDLHGAGAELVGDEDGAVDVLREDAALQAHGGLVGEGHGLLRRGHADEGEHGAEGLLPVDLHLLCHVVDHERVDEVPLALVRARQRGALGLGVLGNAERANQSVGRSVNV